ncbi:MAG: cell division FtsZ family protein [Bacteroidales bacterium]|jgi:cell division protein FtsZ|nr:cell division FtsZ family protein [Bacteroidales bacterium]
MSVFNNNIEPSAPKIEFQEVKVIGVGGAGGQALNLLCTKGVANVDLIACNTDIQDLNRNLAPIHIILGKTVLGGRGAGNNPVVGKEAAIENISEVEEILDAPTVAIDGKTSMVIVVAGMGGGTGTGAAPEIAKAAKDRGILTLGVVITPYIDEGRLRLQQAEDGIKRMKENVDALIIIDNEKTNEYCNCGIKKAYEQINTILVNAVIAITDISTKKGEINIDFNDISSTMKNSGRALIGIGAANGEGRDLKAIKAALDSPLLRDNNINGAQKAIIVLSTNESEEIFQLTIPERNHIMKYLNESAGDNIPKIWGMMSEPSLNEDLRVVIIVTGFEEGDIPGEPDIPIPVNPNAPIIFPQIKEEVVVDTDYFSKNGSFNKENYSYLKDTNTIENNIDKIENFETKS